MLSVRAFAATTLSLALSVLVVSTAAPAAEQPAPAAAQQPKSGGILRMYHRDSGNGILQCLALQRRTGPGARDKTT